MWEFERYAALIALRDDCGNILTYSDIKKETEELQQVIGGRCLIFCLCENTVGSVIGYTTCINFNIVPILLNSHLERGMFYNLAETYNPKFVWMLEKDSNDIKNTRVVYKKYGYVLLKTGYETEHKLYPELALLLTTSGSTGSSKFVRQSYENIESNTNSIIQYLHLDCSEKAITTLPMNYTYGLSIINTHLMVGATLLLTDKGFMQKEFWDFFKKEEATSFGGGTLYL